jgi:glutamate--cysteine ligase
MAAPAVERLGYDELLADVRAALGPSGHGDRRLRMGVEAELIPVRADGSRVRLRDDPHGRATGYELLGSVGGRQGWREERSSKGSPLFRAPGIGVFSFEPGGQVELSTDAFSSVAQVRDAALAALRPLYAEAEGYGIRFLARGMDPVSRAAEVGLQIPSERYRKQRAHYRALGTEGERMMLLSAAIHVNLDLGGRAVRRWRVANRMAPWLTALFANSPSLEGRAAGARSARAEQWRALDPTRTGTFPGDDPAAEYLGFALGAHDFLTPEEGAPARAFRASWEGGADRAAWRSHLRTLFPEVRPRGYLELRSFDALPPRWLVVPLVLAVGALYEPRALVDLEAALPPPTRADLVHAGRVGMADPGVRARALQLYDLAVAGAERLGARVVDADALDVAHAFRDRFAAQGADPGHEPDEASPF